MRADVDVWMPDFEHVKLGTLISFERVPGTTLWSYRYGFDDVLGGLKQGDLLRVVEVHGTRPREVTLEALPTLKKMTLRVDEVLDLHDREVWTILPG